MPLDALRETRVFASETKFLVPAETAEPIREWARRHLMADPHGGGEAGDEYDTSTIYYDTPEYHVFHRRGSFGRSKYRVRRYGRRDQVFLERKLRRPGMLSKRRTLVPLAALSRLDEPAYGWEGDWFHRRLVLRQLRPVCEVGYHRVARMGLGAYGPIRLTLDDQLVAFPAARSAFADHRNGISYLQGQLVLELKYRVTVPPIFKQLVEEFALRPAPVSKYRFGLAALGTPAALSPVSSRPAHDTAAEPFGA
jgi:hypothetical protein